MPAVIPTNSQSFVFLDIRKNNIAKVMSLFSVLGLFQVPPTFRSILHLGFVLPVVWGCVWLFLSALSHPVGSHLHLPLHTLANGVPHKSLLLHPLEVPTNLEASSVLGGVSAPTLAWGTPPSAQEPSATQMNDTTLITCVLLHFNPVHAAWINIVVDREMLTLIKSSLLQHVLFRIN